MESATIRFFGMPELVDHLILNLDRSDISRLMQTSQHLNALYTPAYYHHVSTSFEDPQPNVFSSVESTQALAKNVDRVRYLHIRRLDIVYYINCAITFYDLPSAQQITIIAPERQPALLPPPWLAPPDIQTCSVVPIPPMTFLTKLEVDFAEQDEIENCSHYMPSNRDPKAVLTQVCWIIQSNPRLQDIRLDNVYIKDGRDIRLLVTSISGVRALKRLALEIVYWDASTDSMVSRVRSDLFFACPPTVQSVSLISHQEDLNDRDDFSEEYIQLAPGTLQSWEKCDEGCGLTATIRTAMNRRQEPLLDLKELSLVCSEDDITDHDLLSILQHCPNMTTLGIPTLPAVYNIHNMALKITQYCPKLSDLNNTGFGGRGPQVREVMLWILRLLPEQQVTRIQCTGPLVWDLQGLSSAGSIFRRHSSTLRKIFVTGCRTLDSKAIQAIVVGCGALEQLKVAWAMESNGQRQLCMDLDDAVKFPWVCTKLQELTLAIAIPHHPFHRVAEGVVPYYKRPLLIAFSVEEEQQLKALETLYRQIGSLSGLRWLDLRAEFYDPEGHRSMTRDYRVTSFPAMLSLGCVNTGRPGFLHLFGGLTRLSILEGSISADTEETRVTVGTHEFEWMKQHWPELLCSRGLLDRE
ncbi:hypothetical protein BGX24_003124 [Mortierella sp. AD032]|nr:hypothetical protein BGX24_003124 [Mortierella sp. AD032]